MRKPYDCNHLKCIRVGFMAQSVVHFAECPTCSWEDCVFCCGWPECSVDGSLARLVGHAVQFVLLYPRSFSSTPSFAYRQRGVDVSDCKCRSVYFSVRLYHFFALCILKLPPQLLGGRGWGSCSLVNAVRENKKKRKTEKGKKIAAHLCQSPV